MFPGEFHTAGLDNENRLPDLSFMKQNFSRLIGAFLHGLHDAAQLTRREAMEKRNPSEKGQAGPMLFASKKPEQPFVGSEHAGA